MRSATQRESDNFKVLGLEFDAKLSMRACIHSCVTEAGWRVRSLHAELIGLFKSHILSFLEYRTPGVYHAATTNLWPLDRVLTKFLSGIQISELDA